MTVKKWETRTQGVMILEDIKDILGENSGISKLKLEIILFFKDNPETIDTAPMIAARLGRDTQAVERCLDELSAKDICVKLDERPYQASYIYAPSAHLLKTLAEVAPELSFHTKMELISMLLARPKKGD